MFRTLASAFVALSTALVCGAAAETAQDFKISSTEMSGVVSVKLENISSETKVFRFTVKELTNLESVGLTKQVTKTCAPGVTVPLLLLTRIEEGKPIQLAYDCVSEALPPPAPPVATSDVTATSSEPDSAAATAFITPKTSASSEPHVGRASVAPRPLQAAKAAAQARPAATVAPPIARPQPAPVAKSTTPDPKFLYRLPFAAGAAFKVSQGYHGKKTHHGTYALDFAMPFGAPIHAMRDGVVVVVTSHFPDRARGASGLDYVGSGNAVEIEHADGTTARYDHLKFEGATVQLKQSVKAGDLIGYVGNSGPSTGAHLHVQIADANRRTIPVLFKSVGAPEGMALKEHMMPAATP